jgi:hypothetical protein
MSEFAERVLRRPLWDHQKAAAECNEFIVVIAGGRRSGKSQFSQVKALYTAAMNRDARVLVVSPAVQSTRNYVRDLAELIRDSRLKDSIVDDQAQLVTLSNGSEIRCVAATSAQIRGRGRNLRLAIVDEAAFVPSGVWRDLYYTLFDLRSAGSQAMLTCSPWGGPDHFFRASYERGVAGEPGYASFQWRMQDNPTLDANFIKRERERIAPSEAAAEIDGLWSSAVGALFTQALLDRQCADIEVPDLSSLRPPGRGIIGVDWGLVHDRCAAVGLYRLPIAALNPHAPPTPRYVVFPWVWPQGAELHGVVTELVKSLTPFRFISSEVNGIGAYPSTELRRRGAARRVADKRRWNLVTTTSASKTTGYTLLLGLLEQEKLILPRSPALLRQLAGLRFEQRERGFTRIGADEETVAHDDVADALYLCTLPHRPPGAHRTVCYLARLAASHRIPDARVPDVQAELVETGGGLKLPATPTLQSVASTEYTLYAPQAPVKPEGFTTPGGRYFIKTSKGVGNA